MVDIARDIKKAVTMRQVAEHYGFSVNRSQMISCPFHGVDRHPSMKLYENPPGFYCFACQRKGSVIDFVMEHLGIGFMAACQTLDADFQLNLVGKKQSPAQSREQRRLREKRLEEQRRKAAQRERSEEQYSLLCRYRRTLAQRPQKAWVQKDLAFLDRLLDRYLSPDQLIPFDAKALIRALSSKERGGAHD